MNIQSDITLKSSNTVTTSRINCIVYIPSNKIRKSGNTTKIRHDENQIDLINKEEIITNNERSECIDSLLDTDSSDDDNDNASLNNCSINSFESDLNNEELDTKDPTIWIGTQNGG